MLHLAFYKKSTDFILQWYLGLSWYFLSLEKVKKVSVDLS